MENKLNRQCRLYYFELTCRNLGGKNTAAMKPGERIVICTPGGGGYGNLNEADEKEQKRQKTIHARDQWRGTGSVSNYQAVQESA
jgi:5-oxoprolinase (ATP-hydrolysing)